MRFHTPPEIPPAVLPVVERHEAEWLFYAWEWSGTGPHIQWAGLRYRTPYARWQVFFLRGALRAIQMRRRVAWRATAWLLKGMAAVGLAVGGPIVAWWVITNVLDGG